MRAQHAHDRWERYTSNFALLGLHEAAGALGNATIKDYEDKLADYIVRVSE